MRGTVVGGALRRALATWLPLSQFLFLFWNNAACLGVNTVFKEETGK